MLKHYAQIDADNICIAESWLSGDVDNKNLILLSSDYDVLGKKYNDGKWEDVQVEPSLPQPPSEGDILQAEILLNQMDIMAKQKEHDEILATILLETVTGGI